MSVWAALIDNDGELVEEIFSKDALSPLKELLEYVAKTEFDTEIDCIRESLTGPSRFYFTKNCNRITEALFRPASWGKVVKFQGLMPISLKQYGSTVETVAKHLLEQDNPSLGVLDLSNGDIVPEDLIAISKLADLVERVVVLDLSNNTFTSKQKTLTSGLSAVAFKWKDKADFILVNHNNLWNADLKPPFIFHTRGNLDGLSQENRNHHIRYFHAVNSVRNLASVPPDVLTADK